MSGEIFVDWLTASQHHPQGGLPIVFSGIRSWFDTEGVCRLERACPTTVGGSFDTGVRVGCNGSRVFISGNVGRFGRRDNLFNFGWASTWGAANRILEGLALPPLGVACGVPGDEGYAPGARVSRLDLTANFATGSDGQARAVIRWLAGRSVARMKRGLAGDESCWWSNTRHMFKAYLKGVEMRKHGAGSDDEVAAYCDEHGLVRVEVELKRRLLQEVGLDSVGAITDEKLAALFVEQTEIFRRVDRSEEPDILAALPSRYRMTAAAWLAGQDLRGVVSRATLFRHARVLRDYGIDILQVRNVENFPVRVRVVDLQPLSMPEWYAAKYFKAA